MDAAIGAWIKLFVELGALGVLAFQIWCNAKKDDRIFQYLNDQLVAMKEQTKAQQCLTDAISALKEVVSSCSAREDR